MFTVWATVGSELSTAPFWGSRQSHNRAMNESESPPFVGRFLTISDTAELLNISVSQAYGLVRSGELPAIKIGGHGHWRVERAVLESYIEAMYEEARRISLWNQSDFASLPELSVGLPARHG